MKLLFAASPFDNPWIVAAVLILGALANWFSKRQRDRQQAPEPDDESPAPATPRPTAEFNLEETLRRLLSGEGPMPTLVPAPPVISDPAHPGPVPGRDGLEEELRRADRQAFPIPQPAPPPLPIAPLPPSAVAIELDRATRRFEELNEQGRHPATVAGHRHGHRSRSAARRATRWRDPQTARQALVASIVFAPPKSLEP